MFTDNFNPEALKRSLQYLAKLRRLSERKLRQLHRATFQRCDADWDVRVPSWTHRSILERRLFVLHSMQDYHYPALHPLTAAFKRKASIILGRAVSGDGKPSRLAHKQLRNTAPLTEQHIKKLHIADVDRRLLSFGIFIDADETTRRKVLWEWYNLGTEEISSDGVLQRKIRSLRPAYYANSYVLRDLILENRFIGWREFCEKFRKQMPTVTRASFNNARSELRKAGYVMPRLQPGPSQPAVRGNGKIPVEIVQDG